MNSDAQFQRFAHQSATRIQILRSFDTVLRDIYVQNLQDLRHLFRSVQPENAMWRTSLRLEPGARPVKWYIDLRPYIDVPRAAQVDPAKQGERSFLYGVFEYGPNEARQGEVFAYHTDPDLTGPILGNPVAKSFGDFEENLRLLSRINIPNLVFDLKRGSKYPL